MYQSKFVSNSNYYPDKSFINGKGLNIDINMDDMNILSLTPHRPKQNILEEKVKISQAPKTQMNSPLKQDKMKVISAAQSTINNNRVVIDDLDDMVDAILKEEDDLLIDLKKTSVQQAPLGNLSSTLSPPQSKKYTFQNQDFKNIASQPPSQLTLNQSLTQKNGGQQQRYYEEKKQSKFSTLSGPKNLVKQHLMKIEVQDIDLIEVTEFQNSDDKKNNQEEEEDDDFGFLARQSMERGKMQSKIKLFSNKYQNRNKNLIVESNANTNGIDFDVDDLIQELKNEQSVEFSQRKISVHNGNLAINEQPTLQKQKSIKNQQGSSFLTSKQSTMNKFENDILDSYDGQSISSFLNKIKQKYCNYAPKTQEQMNQIYKSRDGVRAHELFVDKQNPTQLRCWIQGIPQDERVTAKAAFDQKGNEFFGFQRLMLNKGDVIKIVSASVDNTYMLFAYKATQEKDQDEIKDILAVESTNVKPQFNLYPYGYRSYCLKDWNEYGYMDQNLFIQSVMIENGEAPIIPELYLAIKDFNPEDQEPLIANEGVKLLNFRAGEIVQLTLQPGKGGWFEGYRTNDPDCICGIAHISTVKKINFS
ncbi:UNKNOWN [Stylonychia lemnae]|uniref:SH3 domain-containing protein n=1 Tax=Stylonychia lemnae TaxID=5949 RepID=A0A078AGR0_STYLE|nr:UNKNOWN [Stylonychia lemnae]|eukprot:CDW81031.1 UNKNOWN [Stylonychia lemnae]